MTGHTEQLFCFEFRDSDECIEDVTQLSYVDQEKGVYTYHHHDQMGEFKTKTHVKDRVLHV